MDGAITLATGLRVRLRLPNRFDRGRLGGLFAQAGISLDDLELSRLLAFDPRERVALVAVVLVGRAEEIVGFTMMDRSDDRPDLVLGDELRAPGVAALLEDAVRARRRRDHRVA